MKLLTSEPGTARTTENGRVIEVGRRRRESRRDAQRDSSSMAEELFFDGGKVKFGSSTNTASNSSVLTTNLRTSEASNNVEDHANINLIEATDLLRELYKLW
ncbi:hypothetical protein P8452_57244 [Trifolium repens]|nr:hypothetical protein P8452_57244 [Trifolium repens]